MSDRAVFGSKITGKRADAIRCGSSRSGPLPPPTSSLIQDRHRTQNWRNPHLVASGRLTGNDDRTDRSCSSYPPTKPLLAARTAGGTASIAAIRLVMPLSDRAASRSRGRVRPVSGEAQIRHLDCRAIFDQLVGRESAIWVLRCRSIRILLFQLAASIASAARSVVDTEAWRFDSCSAIRYRPLRPLDRSASSEAWTRCPKDMDRIGRIGSLLDG